jgi:hypothetical protein
VILERVWGQLSTEKGMVCRDLTQTVGLSHRQVVRALQKLRLAGRSKVVKPGSGKWFWLKVDQPRKRRVDLLPLTQRWCNMVQLPITNESCWFWAGRHSPRDYGIFRVERRNCFAHRFGYELFRGLIPVGLTIDHLCRNRRCVNPWHLEPVTLQENIRRGVPFRREAAARLRGTPA